MSIEKVGDPVHRNGTASLPSPEDIVINPKLIRQGLNFGHLQQTAQGLRAGKSLDQAVPRGKFKTKLINILRQKGAKEKFLTAVDAENQKKAKAKQSAKEALHAAEHQQRLSALDERVQETKIQDEIGIKFNTYTKNDLEAIGIKEGKFYGVPSFRHDAYRTPFYGKLIGVQIEDDKDFPVLEFLCPNGEKKVTTQVSS